MVFVLVVVVAAGAAIVGFMAGFFFGYTASESMHQR